MKITTVLATSTLAAAALLAADVAQSANINLFDFGLNIDGSTYCGLGPCGTDGLSDLSGVGGVDDSGFDYSSGLGVIEVTIGAAGGHSIVGFFDHEIDETLNGFDNEVGSVSGTAAAGQSWEIDEPGFAFGDIFANFLADTLDDAIFSEGDTIPPFDSDDVAMAMAFAFALGADETATVSFLLSELEPSSGLWLTHMDPDSDASLYFSASLDIEADPGPVPEPGTLALLAAGLLGGFAARRRRT